MFRGLKECEAKNCSNGLEVARAWARIRSCHDLRTFAGPSDSFSDKGADQCRWRRSQNDSFREWRTGNLDGTIESARQQGRADIFILRFYGNADRADRWAAMEAEMWNDRAVEIWGMNYPGFGGSTGPARLARIGPAAVAAFDELRRHATNKSAVESAVPSGPTPSSALGTAHATAPIVLFGTSIGATAALHVAVSRPTEIAGLILQNPPPLREMILRQFGWWNLWLLAGPVALQIPRDLDCIANARASRSPAIFLLAERDEMVAPRFHRLGGSGIRRRKTHHRIARRPSQRSCRRDCAGRFE